MRALLVWAILGSFLSLFASLPLSHDCTDEVGLGWRGASARAAVNSVANQGKHQTAFPKQDVCQACLWSQALHLSRINAGPVLDQAVSPSRIYLAVLLDPTFDFFPATFKRGPPQKRFS